MFISPETVVFAVRALIRVGTAARDAYEQHVRDSPIAIANLSMPPFDSDDLLLAFFVLDDTRNARITTGDLKDLLGSDKKPKSPEARQALKAAALEEMSREPATQGEYAARRLSEEGGAMLLAQWSDKGNKPPSPVTRIALAFADVALEYIAGNPGILGVGGNGEKLIGALAGNLGDLLPDADNPTQWDTKASTYFFAERSLTIVLHAGLRTIDQNPNLVVSQERYQTLLGNVLKPLVERFDTDPNVRPSLSQFRDLLIGPMAEAALSTLQADPRAFLGSKFDPNAAVGAVTIALLDVFTKDGLQNTASTEGLIKLYRAALGVAAARPELFIKGKDLQTEAARNMLKDVTAALQQAPVPLNEKGAIDLSVAALDAISGNLPRLIKLDEGKPWERLAGNLLSDVLTGFKTGLSQGGVDDALAQLFTPDEAFRLINIFLVQAAETPGMITGGGSSTELKGLAGTFAGAIAAAVAAKPNDAGIAAHLLTAADWEAIAATVATEAARNPARLFKLGKDPKDQLLAKVISLILGAAADGFRANGRTGGTLLFGATLRETLQIALRAASGNAARADAHLADLGKLMALLDLLMKDNPGRIGAEAWLFLFKRYTVTVLDEGLPPDLTQAKLLGELKS
jgi:hypothetical protein